MIVEKVDAIALMIIIGGGVLLGITIWTLVVLSEVKDDITSLRIYVSTLKDKDP